MSRKFYKLLIIGNPQITILHIPNSIIPIFHHSIILIAERSGANF
jgi:hypothetical protein